MPKTMRSQRKNAKNAKQKRADQGISRRDAANLLREGVTSIRDVASRTGITKSIAGSISKCLKTNDAIALERLLNPELHHQGRSSVLSVEEERMIVERMSFAARRGFAFDEEDLKTVMASIASDGRPTWKDGVRSPAAVRTFRAKNPEICLRTHTIKDAEKLRAEDPEHLGSYKTVLEEINNLHPGMLKDPSRFWNIDETAVLSEKGRKRKVFGPSCSHQGGFVSQQTGSGEGRHVSAVVAVSAAGHTTPPFL